MRFSSAKLIEFALVLGFAGLGWTGCATQDAKTAFIASSNQNALIRWQQGTQAITGNAIFSRDAQGAVLMDWQETTDAPALRILLTPDGKLSASGSLADRRWTGPVDRAPQSLSLWADFLTTYQHAADLEPGFREIHSPAHRIAYEKTSLGLQSLSVASADIHESIAAAFLPMTPNHSSSVPPLSHPKQTLNN